MHQYNEQKITNLLFRIEPDEEMLDDSYLGESKYSGNFYRKIVIHKSGVVVMTYYFCIDGVFTPIYVIQKRFSSKKFFGIYISTNFAFSLWKIDVDNLVAEIFGRGEGGYSVTPIEDARGI